MTTDPIQPLVHTSSDSSAETRFSAYPEANFTATHCVIICPPATGEGEALYILCQRELVDDAEISLAQVSRALRQKGELTNEAFSHHIRAYGLHTLPAFKSDRPWNALSDDILDTWTVKIPLDAPHCLAGQMLTAIRLHPETDQGIVLQDSVGNYFRSDAEVDVDPVQPDWLANTAPLGQVLMSRRQFADDADAQIRAMNSMRESGFTVALIDDHQ